MPSSLLKFTSFKTLIHPNFHRRTTPATPQFSPAITITPNAALSAHDKAVKLGFCRLKSCSKRGEVDSSGDMSVFEENDCSVTSNLLVNGAVEVSKPVSKHQSTKLLTLPTVLTIARVIAVPVLICSKFSVFVCFSCFEFCMNCLFLLYADVCLRFEDCGVLI